jgi:hypothetical protein
LRALRRARKEARAQRRTRKNGRRLEGRSKGDRVRKHTTLNGCELKGALRRKRELKSALGMKRGLKSALRRGGVRKHTTLDGWEKVVEKYKKIFFLLPNSRGRPTQVKISLRWKFSKSDFKLGPFKVAFHLMDLVRDFSYKVCKTRCPMSQSLDDMLAYLPDLKYRPPFLLNLLICLIDDDLLSLIWVTFIV